MMPSSNGSTNESPPAGSKKKGTKRSASSTPTTLTTANSVGADSSTSSYAASLVRDPTTASMKPRLLVTGFYGSRGERMRHVVHDGALQMPLDALNVMSDQVLSVIPSEILQAAAKKKYHLPGLDSIVRPSLDRSLGSITVTELTSVREVVPPTAMPVGVEGAAIHIGALPTIDVAPPPVVFQTMAVNRVLIFPPTPAATAETTTTERIRGGGDGDEGSEPMKTPADDSTTSPAAAITSIANKPDVNSVVLASSQSASTDGSAPTFVQPGVQQAEAIVDSLIFPSTHQPTLVNAGAAKPQVGIASSRTTLKAAEVIKTTAFAESTVPHAANATSGPFEKASSFDLAAAAVATVPFPLAATPNQARNIDTTTTAALSQPTRASTSLPVVSLEPVVSSTATIIKEPRPSVVPLKVKPDSQWEQLASGPNDDMQMDPQSKTPKPQWYRADGLSSLECTMLPEWFDGSAPHRTEETYRETREKIIHMSDRLGHRNVTATLVRRSIAGDAGSLIRLHSFLNNWGFINEDAINDSTPTPAGFRPETAAGTLPKSKVFWDDQRRDELLEAVVDQARKRPKLNDASSGSTVGHDLIVSLDWDAVALTVGCGASSIDCEREFLSMPLKVPASTLDERSTASDTILEQQFSDGLTRSSENDTVWSESVATLRESTFREIVEGSKPEVVHAVTEAALEATKNNLAEAQRAAIAGLMASQAVERAQSEEDAISRILSELVDHRMQKIENRMAIMDDLEGMLEAERVALELERRDLYTARCRHWFGGS